MYVPLVVHFNLSLPELVDSMLFFYSCIQRGCGMGI